MSGRRIWAEHGGAVLLLAAMTGAVLQSIISLRETPITGDGALEIFPWRVAAFQAWRDGQCSFWSDLYQSGFPLLAEIQVAAFYPPNLLSFLILSPVVAFNLTIVFHYVVRSVLMYLFMREVGAGWAGAILAAVAFTFFEPFAANAAHGGTLTLTWLPLMLLIAHRTLASPKTLSWLETFRNSLFAGVAFALMVLVGYPLVAALGYYTLAAYSVCVSVAAAEGGPLSWGPRLFRAGFFVAFVGMVGAELAAIQLAPTFELAQYSARGLTANPEFAALSSASPLSFITFFLPGISLGSGGGDVIASLYLGLVPAVAAITAVFSLRAGRTGLTAFFAGLAAVSLLLALGRYTPLYEIARHLPGLQSFRGPAHYAHVAAFALSALAGLGIDRISQWAAAREYLRAQFTARVSLALALVLVGGIGVANVAFAVAGPQIKAWGLEYVRQRVFGEAFHQQPWEYYVAKVDLIYDGLFTAVSIDNPVVRGSLVVMAGIVLLMLIWRVMPSTGRFVVPSLLIFAVAETVSGQFGLPPTIPTAQALETPSLAHAIKSLGPGRMYRFVEPQHVKPTTEDTIQGLRECYNGVFGLPSIGINDALPLERNERLLRDLGAIDWGLGVAPTDDDTFFERLPVLNALNVRFIVARHDLVDPRLVWRWSDGDLRLYENTAALPRAYMVPSALTVKSEPEALAAVLSTGFDGRRQVVLEGTTSAPSFVADPDSAVRIEQEGPGLVTLNVETRSGGYLVLADSFYPGWRAQVDGTDAPILRANYVVRAVAVTPGVHTVTFRFESQMVRIGTWVSAVSLVGLLIVLVCCQVILRRRYENRGSDFGAVRLQYQKASRTRTSPGRQRK